MLTSQKFSTRCIKIMQINFKTQRKIAIMVKFSSYFGIHQRTKARLRSLMQYIKLEINMVVPAFSQYCIFIWQNFTKQCSTQCRYNASRYRNYSFFCCSPFRSGKSTFIRSIQITFLIL